MQVFLELIEQSQREKKGLTFYVNGQIVIGIVTQILADATAVELRNQSESRVVLRLERVDAVGIG